ncbi:MAG: GIY-YIG nuclease family protein [Anaerolineales bacterium]|nr:GIY-YIG nuclease family protein [Anaerolineales bacterium]
MQYFVYILFCADGSYYTGSTSNLERRIAQHQAGEIPGAYTRSRRPVKLVWFESFSTENDALKAERQIKGWSRAKKAALIENDWDKIHQIVRNERAAREQKKRSNKK